MISSVIAKLNCNAETVKKATLELASHAAVEIGELVEGRMLPATIDTRCDQETKEITQWMQTIDGVAFVDVVFVHFEDEESDASLRDTEKRLE